MGVAIRRAGETDREEVTRLLDEAFQDDPVSSWIFPGADHRRRTHPLLMGAFLDIVLDAGYADVTEDGSACALWLSIPAGPQEEDEEGPARLRAAVDPGNERVELVARLTAEAHPAGAAHEYLWMIAVRPERQGEGLGTALVERVLERCDGEGRAAYLEASGERSRGLYERLGFAFTGRPVALPAGPFMWPMWREPSHSPPRDR
ncbi:GNAT family N-acetyltransferase [Streptomyces ortus]|uniref:GNAT family N-acetyltransferase n=1 Tax=Streptomyces ortus TaxID=2867268 RepID=A0ABT3V7W5_9ACTN|nr:GNAT family N-acetyltransferase [Streptomyces ortus]MCX4234388.1 GNAT family N-acetyltransferase [Streptomyces ortus]